MKTFKDWVVIPATLAMLLIGAGVVRSQPLQISPGFQPDPLAVTGTSGGSQPSKGCGMIRPTPNHVVTLTENFNYLRFKVQSAGEPTLLIEGPSGTSCVQADQFSGGTIQAPGYWEKGIYRVYIGDRAGNEHPYTLSLTQKQ